MRKKSKAFLISLKGLIEKKVWETFLYSLESILIKEEQPNLNTQTVLDKKLKLL